jgi:hypothetical protein
MSEEREEEQQLGQASAVRKSSVGVQGEQLQRALQDTSWLAVCVSLDVSGCAMDEQQCSSLLCSAATSAVHCRQLRLDSCLLRDAHLPIAASPPLQTALAALLDRCVLLSACDNCLTWRTCVAFTALCSASSSSAAANRNKCAVHLYGNAIAPALLRRLHCACSALSDAAPLLLRDEAAQLRAQTQQKAPSSDALLERPTSPVSAAAEESDTDDSDFEWEEPADCTLGAVADDKLEVLDGTVEAVEFATAAAAEDVAKALRVRMGPAVRSIAVVGREDFPIPVLIEVLPRLTLTQLRLEKCKLRADVLSVLSSPTLRRLSLRDNLISDADVKAPSFSQQQGLVQLTCLSLENNPLGGCEKLCSVLFPLWSRLRRVELRGCGIVDVAPLLSAAYLYPSLRVVLLDAESTSAPPSLLYAALFRELETRLSPSEVLASASSPGSHVKRPLAALVPRPPRGLSMVDIAARWGVPLNGKTVESNGSTTPREPSVGSPRGRTTSVDDNDPVSLRNRLQQSEEDRQTLVALYEKLLIEHAALCSEYDEAVKKAGKAGVVLTDLHVVRAKAMETSPKK